jgi:hypothetical protein
MPHPEEPAPLTPDEERKRREAEEIESFERRAEWSRLHYGTPPADADDRSRKAVEQAEAMPDEDATPPHEDREPEG